MRALLVAALVGASVGVAAEPVTYRLDPEATHVHFELSHFGTSTIRGRFESIDGSIALDRAARAGTVSIVVRTASVSTGVRPFDGAIRGGDLLNAAAFPDAFFVARRIEYEGDTPARIHGELTLRGTSRPLLLQALRFRCAPRGTPLREVCGGDFEATLQRSDFGITFGLPFVGDRVRLVIQVEASPA